MKSTNCCTWFPVLSELVSGFMSGMAPMAPTTMVPP
jgi:hypothetical protein